MPYQEPDPTVEVELTSVRKFTVDVQTVTTQTYQVFATSEEEARERYSDGLIIHSEATSPAVNAVHVEEQN